MNISQSNDTRQFVFNCIWMFTQFFYQSIFKSQCVNSVEITMQKEMFSQSRPLGVVARETTTTVVQTTSGRGCALHSL